MSILYFMINNILSEALLDPELGFSSFTVERLTYTRTPTGTEPRSQTFQALGCIHPATPEQLEAVPEEDRHETAIAIYTDFTLSLGQDHGVSYVAPDRIHWAGETWWLTRLRDWSQFGYYQGTAVKLQGA